MMDKKVLLLYHYYHHHLMVERLAKTMLSYGVSIDLLCMDNFRLVRNNDFKLNSFSVVLLSILSKCRSESLLRIIRKIFPNQLLHSLISQYDLIDFHAYSVNYISYMRFAVEKGIPFDITLWGSDIMRANDDLLVKKRWGFENCRYIKCTENLRQVLSEKYAGVFDYKVKNVYFGNSEYELIDTILPQTVQEFRNSLLGDGCSILVSCGYNGSEAQNHFSIIKALESLPQEIKSRVFFLFPMTYGGSSDYLSKVRRTLHETGIRFRIIDDYVPAEDIAIIRLASDVVLNIQKTDAFSASLQGHLYCNNVLIVGEWLNYIALDKAGVFYIKTPLSQLRNHLIEVLTDLQSFKNKCVSNHNVMKQMTSWPSVIPTWADTYRV